ncbi:MAG: aspartate ammonia-lyase, partial [Thaumarchaeota archaeon]|nr:aspartate ammonia-lyase [Nitrososphaerota archaeon]
MEFRIERDSLGEVKVPSEAYYGAFTSRAINQYHVTGLRPHINLIIAFVMIKRSAAVANMKVKAIDAKRGNAIVKACDKIISGKFLDQFVIEPINSGAGTAFNMNTNEVIANIALEILGEKKG